MTPEERAEKIHSETCGEEDPRPSEECIAWIAAQIREAVEEAIRARKDELSGGVGKCRSDCPGIEPDGEPWHIHEEGK